MTPIRVLVADDQQLVRAGFRVILGQQPGIVVVGEAADGREAVDLSTTLQPDVVLMDVQMPRWDGVWATGQIVARGLGTRVLMLTTFDADEYVYDSLRAGASGFLLKDAREDQLADAIRVVAAGDSMLAPSVTRRLIADFADRTRPSGHHTRLPTDLTTRELDVVREVARGRSNVEIAGSLVLSSHTVKTHVARVLAKCGLRDRTQLAVLAYESGLVVPGEG